METIDDAIAAMDALLERAVAANDPRAYFTAVYRAVTARVRDGVLAGEFDDAERMVRFDVAFARLYLDAAADHARGARVPESWRVVFEAPTRSTLVLQHVLVGMNAHINLDLGVAAARTQRGMEVAALRDDFERLNDVLSSMVDRMQSALALVSPWTALVDRVGCRFDEAFASWSVAEARSRSWTFAEALALAGEPDQVRLVTARDLQVARLGRRILSPRGPARWVCEAASRRERADVGAVVEALTRASV